MGQESFTDDRELLADVFAQAARLRSYGPHCCAIAAISPAAWRESALQSGQGRKGVVDRTT